MRKLISLLLTLALLLFMGMGAVARAEDGDIPEEWLGEGEGDTTICVFVAATEDKDGVIVYVDTNENNLLDALLKVELISGEEASWGFNVTTVHGTKADYEGKGEYWSIYVYDAAEEDFVRLETAIGSTPVAEGDLYLFNLEY